MRGGYFRARCRLSEWFDGIASCWARFTGETSRLLESAVSKRNSLVHKGELVDYEFAERDIRTVRNMLWLLDYYEGHSWAMKYLDRKLLES